MLVVTVVACAIRVVLNDITGQIITLRFDNHFLVGNGPRFNYITHMIFELGPTSPCEPLKVRIITP